MLECQIHKALSNMTEKDRCIPWYYPQIDEELRLCSPYEALDLRSMIDSQPTNLCQVFSNIGKTLQSNTQTFVKNHSTVCLTVMKLSTHQVSQLLHLIDVTSSPWD